MSATLPTARRGPSRALLLRPAAPPVSLRLDVRVGVLGAVAAAALAVLAVVAMTLGDYPLALADVVTGALGGGEGREAFVVRTLRMPRVVNAVLVGAALAASGAIFQGLVRNPLVAPDIIGVNAGAGLAAVFLIVTRGPLALVPFAAFAGAVATAFAVYWLTWRKGVTAGRLVLVGIGMNAALAAGTTFLIVRFPIEQVAPAVLWLTGTLYGRGWDHAAGVAVGLGLLLPAALLLQRQLRSLQLGEDLARGLGTRTEAVRAALLVVGSGLAAVAVAAAGPIGFVALIVPHAARLLVGPLRGGGLLLVAQLGALLTLGADVLGQHAFNPVSLPVGVVTAVIGAPFFLYLLHRTNART